MGQTGVFCRMPEIGGWRCELGRGFRSQMTNVGSGWVLEARWKLEVGWQLWFLGEHEISGFQCEDGRKNIKMAFSGLDWVKSDRYREGCFSPLHTTFWDRVVKFGAEVKWCNGGRSLNWVREKLCILGTIGPSKFRNGMRVKWRNNRWMGWVLIRR